MKTLFAVLWIAAWLFVIGINVYDELDFRKKQRRHARTMPAPLDDLGRRG